MQSVKNFHTFAPLIYIAVITRKSAYSVIYSISAAAFNRMALATK